jgi:hypothetical protein
MRSGAFPLLGAAALGFLAAAVCFSAWSPRPAVAQAKVPVIGQPLGVPLQSATAGMPQPISVQALDSSHFVVATREPKLVSQLGREGTAQNMLVTVVTHYTVTADGLRSMEHVQVPTGFRAVSLEE